MNSALSACSLPPPPPPARHRPLPPTPSKIIATVTARFCHDSCRLVRVADDYPSSRSTSYDERRARCLPNTSPPVTPGVAAVLVLEARWLQRRTTTDARGSSRFRRFLSGLRLAIYCRRLARQSRPAANVGRQRGAEQTQTPDTAHWHPVLPDGFSCPDVQLLFVKESVAPS